MDQNENNMTSSANDQDVLLESLAHICSLEGKVVGRSALLAELPLVNGKLSPELFLRAAARAGLEAKIVEREFKAISALVLPAVALFADNKVLVIEGINEEGDYSYFDPQIGENARATLDELQQDYSGLCIYIRSDYSLEARVEQGETRTEPHWFWSTLGRSWRIYRDVLIASFMINIFVIANPLFVMNVYDRVVPNNAIETLWALALGILVLYSFDFILRLLRTYFIEVAGKKSDVLLSTFIMEKVLGAHYSEHPQSVGAFASKIKEFEAIRNFITSATISTFVDLPFVALFIVVVTYIGGPIAWVPIVAIPLILSYSWFVQRKLKLLVSNTFVASAQKNATLVEALSNLETLKGLGAEGRVIRKWESAVGTLSLWGLRWRIFSSSATTFSAFVQQMAGVFVVVVGVYSIAENELTQGALIASVILVSRALAPLAQVSGLLVQYHQAKLALDALEEIVTRQQERPKHKKFIERLSFQGAIEFKNVDFSYPNETIASLNGVSFKINPGEKVGIIGRIGSGKSTLHKLLMGLYQVSNGSILLDGIDIMQLDPAQLRNNIGYVPQESVLFYGSIRENIAFHQTNLSDEEIIRAADIAGVMDFVNQHPKGFERIVGERGEGLSGGQKQAINIARALVSKAPIALLDEPSMAMDNASELRLLANLQKELASKTLVLVTHKSAMLELVDRIIVLEAGRIIADGAKDRILDALKKGQLRVAK